VVAEGEIEVFADAGLVWSVMTAVDRWPEWNPDVRSASLEGEPAEGKTFQWRVGPGTIT